MHMIPGKTKVKIELFKGVTIGDFLVVAFTLTLLGFMVTSSIPGKLWISGGILLLAIGLLVRIDTAPNYVYLLHILRHYGYRRGYARSVTDRMLATDRPDPAAPEELQKNFQKQDSEEDSLPHGKELKRLREEEKRQLKRKDLTDEEREALLSRRKEREDKLFQIYLEEKDAAKRRRKVEDITAFRAIRDNLIVFERGYFGAVLEIPPVEFRFFSKSRRALSIEQGLGKVLRSVNPEFAANIVKLERPVLYDEYMEKEMTRLDEARAAYESGLLNEKELQARVEILYDRIYELQNYCGADKVVVPFYYLVLFESDQRQLELQISSALDTLRSGELNARRLNSKELAVFLRYSNQLDFDERDIEKIDPEDYAKWAMPQTVEITPRRAVVDRVVSYTFRAVTYPTMVGDAWLAGVFSMPGTKCVLKCRPMDRAKAVRAIDHSLTELRGQYSATGVESKQMELATHIETLSQLLATLQGDNESLLEVNVYVTAYDIAQTRSDGSLLQPGPSALANISNMKRAVRRLYQESGIRLNNLEFDQVQGYIASQISGWDPFHQEGRGMPSNTIAAAYPWIYANISDKGGIHLGSSDGVPVFLDFFRRDNERVNSNMVIVGKSGSGKSYATKTLLSNLAADDSKIFILDPENEYAELAANLSGKFINVGNASQGRLNPFHIITALEDDEGGEGVGSSYATHLQFLEEFFAQALPDCEKDALEYLNSLIDRMYRAKNIDGETDLSRLRPEDYPVFDDLYDTILMEFQRSKNDYIRSMLRILMNYVAKFSTGGRNAAIWNGPSSVTTEENFIVFNFQSLLANRNSTIANAQMLLVLKYIDNEIIKNRDYNKKYGLNRKVIVVIDEAHVFIDAKYPAALDFMFQLAKRIRKYNGMQIVITQNIKDFVGSEELARKSTAIINACQYSLIFSLAPDDMGDLCKLYEKAGGINENEQEQIISANRGQAFAILGPASRTSFKVETPQGIEALFSSMNYRSAYFFGEAGTQVWEEFISDSRAKRLEWRLDEEDEGADAATDGSSVSLVDLIEIDDAPEEAAEPLQEQSAAPEQSAALSPKETLWAEETVPDTQGGHVEQLLTRMMGQFSYDAIRAEVQRAVRSELAGMGLDQRETPLPARPDAPAWGIEPAPAAPERVSAAAEPVPEHPSAPEPVPERPSAPEPVPEPEPLPEERPIAVPAAEIAAEQPTLAAAEPLPDAPETPSVLPWERADEEEEEGLDLISLLADYPSEGKELGPIEMMELNGETCIEVSLETLTAYNAKRL